ncbi:outer membrane beta-barrel protein [Lacinutrix chionoecetis]
MLLSFQNKLFTSLFLILLTYSVSAQTETKRFVKASIGLGYSYPSEEVDVAGSGFYIQGEYVFKFSKWLSARPYAGYISTSPDSELTAENDAGYQVTANAFLLGAKGRLTFPIPWVSPYIETGIGTSIGSFRTFIPGTDFDISGILIHIPATIGLGIGRNNGLEIEFTYFIHPSAEQFSGAAAIGFNFPLN